MGHPHDQPCWNHETPGTDANHESPTNDHPWKYSKHILPYHRDAGEWSSTWNLCISLTNRLCNPWPLHPGAHPCHAVICSTPLNLLSSFTLPQDTSWSTRQHLLCRIQINEENVSYSCLNHYSFLVNTFPFSHHFSQSIHILCVATGFLCLEINWFNRYTIHVCLWRNLLNWKKKKTTTHKHPFWIQHPRKLSQNRNTSHKRQIWWVLN